MSAVNVFPAIVGVVITGLVIAGMVLLEPRHLISPAPQTELPDVKPSQPAGRHTRTKPATEPDAEQPRDQLAAVRASPDGEDRPADDRRT